MVGLIRGDRDELQLKLRDAVIQCSERCLYLSAKWAAELLNSFADSASSPADTEVDSPMEDWDSLEPVKLFVKNKNYKEARLEVAELPKYLLAKSFFDCREYDRCAAVFLPTTLPKGSLADRSSKGKARDVDEALREVSRSKGYLHLSQKALFLALYAKYMSGEKRKDEESETILGPADGGGSVNRELLQISEALESRFAVKGEDHDDGQGWLEYLYGVVLAKGKNETEARKWLIRSVNRYPHNWGAWQELCSLLKSKEDLNAIGRELSQNLMTFIFDVYARQELFQTQPGVYEGLKQVKAIFPASSFVRAQKALLRYHDKDLERSEKTFSKLLERDPLRLDNLDTLSNILFVRGSHAKLAFIAQLSTATDKFRPETCIVVGNYYALKSEHEKAVLYFRRALTLDRNFQSAWTLMGHEYMELRNTHAAIECYRRAVDINNKDYRAWHGLGQTYEIMDMALYSLHYFERAASLCPTDAKLWFSVGTAQAKVNRPERAIKAYKRALVYSEHVGAASSFGSNSQRSADSERRKPLDPEIVFAIAQNYDRLGDARETEAYLRLTLAQEEGLASYAEAESGAAADDAEGRAGRVEAQGGGAGGVGVTDTTSRARMWLARIEFAKGDVEALRRSYELANEMCQDGWEVDEAKALIRDIRERMEWVGGAGD